LENNRLGAPPGPARFETAPGVQAQADWGHVRSWPLGGKMVELHAMVAVLGHSRRPAMATCCTREVSFGRLVRYERLVRCLNDLGGVSREILTDRDTVFWISTSGTLSLSGRSSSSVVSRN
jgi:transposase